MYLYGSGGHAKVIIDILQACRVEVEALYDDNGDVHELMGYPVWHTAEVKGPLIVSIGDNRIRKEIAGRVGVDFGQAIHPAAIVSRYARIGAGTVVMQGAVVQADARIGRHCIVNTGAVADHDCMVADYVHLAPRCTLCGGVQVGEGSWLGAGTVVAPGVKVGRWCVVRPGSVLTQDVPDNILYDGCRV